MPKEKYIITELSPTRIWVENKSFWRFISRDTIAQIIEDFARSGKKVISTIPFNNGTSGRDYLIILQP